MKKILVLSVLALFLMACGKSEKEAKFVVLEPSEIIVKNNGDKEYSIVLDNMKIEEEPSLMVYKHKYKVLKMIGDSLHVDQKDWATVNKSFFKMHENDLGMEIISNHDGKLSRITKPLGFGWAIGNEKHGEWEAVQQKDSVNTKKNKRWRTHSSSPFFWLWLSSRRNVYSNDYNSYRSYNNVNKSYYGYSRSNNSYNYGTRSSYQKKYRRSFFVRRSQNSSRWNSLSTRSSRKSSRYKNGSSTRSRSGGYGK